MVVDGQWNNICNDCDIDSRPSQSNMGKMRLDQCKQECVDTEGCTAIDFGYIDSGGGYKSCYLNYGGFTTFKQTNDQQNLDAYTLKGEIYLIIV